MTALLEQRLRVAAPSGWVRVPNGRVPGLAAGRPGLAFVLTGDGDVVQAWAFLRLLPRAEADPALAAAAALDILRGPVEDGEVAVRHREVWSAEVAGDPSVLLTDLLLVDRGDGVREAQRRAVVARFPPDPVCLHLTVSTPSSTVLPDLAGDALAFTAAAVLSEGAA